MANPTYVWRVYVAGQKGQSRWAVQNLKKICEKELPGQYKIEVVDVSRIAVENNLIALPAVRKNRASEPSELPSPPLSEPEANRAGTMHKPRRTAERGL
jgi:hypothetical protein